MSSRHCIVPALLLVGALMGLANAPENVSAQPARKSNGDFKAWTQAVDKAVAYLRRTQAKDGSWGGAQAPGVTGVVVAGLMQTTNLGPKDPMVARALKYIEGLIDPKTGHIAGKGAALKVQNYVTSINVMALASADRVRYKVVIDKATTFLRHLQWDEGEGKKKSDPFYGGAGYDSKSRPDLSNTQFFLDALIDGGVAKSDPAFKKAVIFVSRSQNLKGEHNNQPWAGKINDGSFIYTPALGGATKVQEKPNADGGLPGYGSMTYAGVKSLLYCGVSRDDERMVKAIGWLKKHYSVSANPGMPKARAHWGLYYYYMTMARCLSVLGDDFVKDKITTTNWRADLTEAIVGLQRPEGNWINDNKQWMESNPHLATGYALLALANCKP
jgi:squalene-hopene/tetraprenyl-beta-curcumene cyclase